MYACVGGKDGEGKERRVYLFVDISVSVQEPAKVSMQMLFIMADFSHPLLRIVSDIFIVSAGGSINQLSMRH